MPTTQKDVLYIDVDDEITAIIDRLRSSPQRIVALVLPKRATVLQSIVNMKLLKRTAENSQKHVVLITSEAGLLPLAGAVGMHVASSLQTRPSIPPAPDMAAPGVDAGDDFDPDTALDQPVGRLAGAGAGSAAAAAAKSPEATETIQLDNATPAPVIGAAAAGTAAGASAAGKAAKPTKGKDRKLKVPNFNKFRMAIVLGLLAIVLLGGGFAYANSAMPKATIAIGTDSSDIDTRETLTIDPNLTELDVEEGVVPARTAQKQQTSTQQVSTTGQKNNGTKATGSVTLSLKTCDREKVTIPAGTGVSSGGKTFITQASATLESVEVGGNCRNAQYKSDSTEDVTVVSQAAGASYNVAPASFAVAGYADVVGTSAEPMTGGTDNIVKTVAQADIDSAKQKMAAQDEDSVLGDLRDQLEADGYYALEESLHAGEPTITPSAAVGDQSDTVTVTQQTIYTLYGVKADDIKKVIVANVEEEIDPSKQQILNDGFSDASFKIDQKAASGSLQVILTASSLAGPDIDTAELKKSLGGLKPGDVKSKLQAVPGVTSVDVELSPFWVSAVPEKEQKVDIVVKKAAGQNSNAGAE